MRKCTSNRRGSHGWFMVSETLVAPVRRPLRAPVLLICLAAFVAAAIAAVAIGSRRLDFAAALHGVSPDREILLQLRLPRALLSLWTGGALALAGVLFQALLRNALAT